MKRCTKCGETKPESEYHKNARYRGELVTWCKVCVNSNSRAWAKRRRETRACWPSVMLPLIKRRAKNAGIEFDLTEEDIVIPERCPILGVILERGTDGRASPNSPSVDRIDSTKGYVRGNIAVMSYRANVIKNDGNAAEHRLIADWIDRQNVA